MEEMAAVLTGALGIIHSKGHTTGGISRHRWHWLGFVFEVEEQLLGPLGEVICGVSEPQPCL